MDLARKKLSPQATSGLRGSWLAIYYIVLCAITLIHYYTRVCITGRTAGLPLSHTQPLIHFAQTQVESGRHIGR